jgi:hypothetical protein
MTVPACDIENTKVDLSYISSLQHKHANENCKPHGHESGQHNAFSTQTRRRDSSARILRGCRRRRLWRATASVTRTIAASGTTSLCRSGCNRGGRGGGARHKAEGGWGVARTLLGGLGGELRPELVRGAEQAIAAVGRGRRCNLSAS